MRCALWLRCTAGVGVIPPVSAAATASTSASAEATTNAAAPAGLKSASASEKAAGDAKTSQNKGKQDQPKKKSDTLSPPPQQRAFGIFTLQKWQTFTVANDSDRALLPNSMLYFGDRLGPRPLIILDHSAANVEGEKSKQEAMKYEAMLSKLEWAHGAIYVPLPASPQQPDALGKSCKQVCAVMDALNVRWSHFLTHGYGALVAARMAASVDFPHRIGTFLSLDTPLISAELVRNMEQREEIAKAEEDVNVSVDELAFAKESLLTELEPILSCPTPDFDKEIYEKFLFDPSAIFSRDGLIRDESRYVPVRELRGVQHPLQLIVPSAGAVCDVTAHKDFFGIRRPAVIKAASSHDELFKGRGAEEVAEVVGAWVSRFEPDVVLKRRYEQAAKEMTQLLSGAQPGEAGAGQAAGDSKKKKEKKKKN